MKILCTKIKMVPSNRHVLLNCCSNLKYTQQWVYGIWRSLLELFSYFDICHDAIKIICQMSYHHMSDDAALVVSSTSVTSLALLIVPIFLVSVLDVVVIEDRLSEWLKGEKSFRKVRALHRISHIFVLMEKFDERSLYSNITSMAGLM